MCVTEREEGGRRREGKGKGVGQRLETTQSRVPGSRGEVRNPIGKKQKGNRGGKERLGALKGKLAQAPSLLLAPSSELLSLALTLALALLEEESRHRGRPYGSGIPMPSLGKECRACHI